MRFGWLVVPGLLLLALVLLGCSTGPDLAPGERWRPKVYKLWSAPFWRTPGDNRKPVDNAGDR